MVREPRMRLNTGDFRHMAADAVIRRAGFAGPGLLEFPHVVFGLVACPMAIEAFRIVKPRFGFDIPVR